MLKYQSYQGPPGAAAEMVSVVVSAGLPFLGPWQMIELVVADLKSDRSLQPAIEGKHFLLRSFRAC